MGKGLDRKKAKKEQVGGSSHVGAQRMQQQTCAAAGGRGGTLDFARDSGAAATTFSFSSESRLNTQQQPSIPPAAIYKSQRLGTTNLRHLVVALLFRKP